MTKRELATMVLMSNKLTDEQKVFHLEQELGFNLIEILELALDLGFAQDKVGA